MRTNNKEILIYIAVIAGIALFSVAIVYNSVMKYIDLAVFALFIGFSVVCTVCRIRGSALILACWCVISTVAVVSRFYPFSADGYVWFVSCVLPIAEAVCALLTGLWLIRLQQGRGGKRNEHRA